MMTMEEYAKMCEEDERQIQAHPCCANCIYCHMMYGQYECAYEGDDVPASEEEWEPSKDICDRWHSDTSGKNQRGEYYGSH